MDEYDETEFRDMIFGEGGRLKCIVAERINSQSLCGFMLFQSYFSVLDGKTAFMSDLSIRPQDANAGIAVKLTDYYVRVRSNGQKTLFDFQFLL